MHASKRKSDSMNPGPSAMSKTQMRDYLHDLRTNRPHRPQASIGPRPLHSHSSHYSLGGDFAGGSNLPRLSYSSAESDRLHGPSRSSSSLSHRRSLNLSLSTRSSSDDRRSSGYFERSERQKELAEARDVRLALEQMDLEDEQRVMSAAKEEADELVRQHKETYAPFRNPQHYDADATKAAPSSLENIVPEEPIRRLVSPTPLDLDSIDGSLPQITKRSSYSKLANYWNNTGLANRRRSSGSRRSTSGKQRGIFVNPEDRIYEDPAECLPSAVEPTPSAEPPAKSNFMEPPHSRRNPFARARTVKQALPIPSDNVTAELKQPQERSEAQKDPTILSYTRSAASEDTSLSNDASSTNPNCTGDNETKYRDGIEVRNADLRAATSMRFRDRSSKLPSPTAVSDNPSRPIVSFKPDWTPPVLEDKTNERTSTRPPPMPSHAGRAFQSDVPEPVKSASSPAVPTIGDSRNPRIQINNGRVAPIMSIPNHPSSDYKVPAIPATMPRIDAFGPSGKDASGEDVDAQSAVPTRNRTRNAVPNPPSIVVEEPTSTIDELNQPRDVGPKTGPSFRYSPFPKSRPSPTHSATSPVAAKPSWSTTVRRTTALCAQCALPIAGKIVSAAGLRFHPNCFTCYHCGEGLECVDFYPEPAEARDGRIERIQRRMNGEHIDEIEGATQADDGDDSLRFYCHLDFHEFFSPRCKSCKTPIEGEVIVACGAEWHVGHFFCAQCGDPFDQSTPFVEKDGYAWCVECHTNRYSAKCKKCKRPVTNMVVQALGGEWHNECFCCSTCNSSFEDGRFFLRPGTQDPVCMACEEKRLKA